MEFRSNMMKFGWIFAGIGAALHVAASDDSHIRTGHEWKFSAASDVLYEPVESDFIATVTVVDFEKCDKYPSNADFYKGMIVNFHKYEIWHTPQNPPPILPPPPYRAHLLTNVNSIKNPSGSNLSRYEVKSGRAYLSTVYNNLAWGIMEWPYDIRRQNFTFEFETFCGMSQLYIPLIAWEDSSLRGKKAFMLHIYPDPKLMPGVPDPYYKSAVQWYRKSDYTKLGQVCKEKVTFKIDLFQLLGNMESYYLTDIHKGIKGTYNYGETSVSQANVKTQPLLGPKKGNADENLCSIIKAESLLDFKTFYSIAKKVIGWLPSRNTTTSYEI